MRIVLLKLKGPWSPGGTDEDRGIVQLGYPGHISLADNDHGLRTRTYKLEDVARVDEKTGWSD